MEHTFQPKNDRIRKRDKAHTEMEFILLVRFESSDQSLTKGMLPRINLKLGEKTRKGMGKKTLLWTVDDTEQQREMMDGKGRMKK